MDSLLKVELAKMVSAIRECPADKYYAYIVLDDSEDNPKRGALGCYRYKYHRHTPLGAMMDLDDYLRLFIRPREPSKGAEAKKAIVRAIVEYAKVRGADLDEVVI